VEGHVVAETQEKRAELVQQYRQRAADLLHTTGFDPSGFRMFR
jgi:late competence protein required for DNA uptake (superfamily II DNA/RNA helicase)